MASFIKIKIEEDLTAYGKHNLIKFVLNGSGKFHVSAVSLEGNQDEVDSS